MKTKLFIAFIFFFISQIAYSQLDSSLVNKSDKSIINCEANSAEAQKQIVKYSIKQADGILLALKPWEDYCKYTEPILRLKIVLSISQIQEFDSLAKIYFDNYFDRYIARIHESTNENR